LRHAGKAPLANLRFTVTQTTQRLRHALPDTELLRARLSAHSQQLSTRFASRHAAAVHQFDSLRAQLELLAPQRTLERGYAIVQDAEGRILRDSADLAEKESIELRLAKGQAHIKIAKVSQR
jgi:exodeoxyribonuclease VII large subunit